MKESHVSMQSYSTGLRAIFERVFAGLVFTATVALVVGGTIAICLRGTPLVA